MHTAQTVIADQTVHEPITWRFICGRCVSIKIYSRYRLCVIWLNELWNSMFRSDRLHGAATQTNGYKNGIRYLVCVCVLYEINDSNRWLNESVWLVYFYFYFLFFSIFSHRQPLTHGLNQHTHSQTSLILNTLQIMIFLLLR